MRIATSLAFLAVASAFAAEIPLSPERIAPIPGFVPGGMAAGDDAVLLVGAIRSTLVYQRIAPDGTLIDPVLRSFEFPPGPFQPQVSWNGSNWVVYFGGGHSHWLVGIGRDGLVLGEPIPAIGSRIESSRGETALASYDGRHIDVFRIGRAVQRRLRTIETPPPDRGQLPMFRGIAWFDWEWAAVRFRPGSRHHDPEYFVVLPDGSESKLTAPVSSDARFVAHPAGGGLLWWRTTASPGLSAAILSSDGSWSDRIDVGSHSGAIGPIPTDGGWTFWAGERVTVGLDGKVSRRPFPTIEMPILLQGGPVAASLLGHDLFATSHLAGVRIDAVDPSRRTQSTFAATTAAAQQTPRVATGPGIHLVTWSETSASGLELRASRVLPDGRPLDGDGILLENAVRRHDVVWDGATFVIAWTTEAGVFSRRVTLAGELPDPEPIRVDSASSDRVRVASAANGASLIQWQTTSVPRREFARSLRRGAASPVTMPLPEAPEGRGETGLAALGETYLLAWVGQQTWRWPPAAVPKDVYTQILDRDGVPLGAPRKLTRAHELSSPTVVASRDAWIVTWEDFGGRKAVKIDRNGTVVAEGDMVPGLTAADFDGESLVETTPDGVMTFAPDLTPLSWRSFVLPETRIGGEEAIVRAASAEGTLLLVERTELQPRLYLRTPSFAGGSSDVAIVSGSCSRSRGSATESVRIENRGTDGSLAFLDTTPPGIWTQAATPPFGYGAPLLRVGESLRPGEAQTLEVRFRMGDHAALWALPVAADPDASNNLLRLSCPRSRLTSSP